MISFITNAMDPYSCKIASDDGETFKLWTPCKIEPYIMKRDAVSDLKSILEAALNTSAEEYGDS